MQVRSRTWSILLGVLASPMMLLVGIAKAVRYVTAVFRARRPRYVCRTCGADIPLLGFWRCHCGYTYRGHLLSYCPVCGSLPRIVRCYRCGATELAPH